MFILIKFIAPPSHSIISPIAAEGRTAKVGRNKLYIYRANYGKQFY